MSDETTPQDGKAMSPASTGSLANAHSALQDADAKIIADGIAEIMRIASEPDWIPVAERLPADGEEVLAYADGRRCNAEFWRSEWWHACQGFERRGGRILKRVSHWMPLPAPPTDAK